MKFDNKYTKAAEKYWNDKLRDGDIVIHTGFLDWDGTYTIGNIRKYNLDNPITALGYTGKKSYEGTSVISKIMSDKTFERSRK